MLLNVSHRMHPVWQMSLRAGVLACAIGLAACSTTSVTKQQVGTATGAVVGGVVGAYVTGGSTAGAVAGAAGGALVGNHVGKQLDKVK